MAFGGVAPAAAGVLPAGWIAVPVLVIQTFGRPWTAMALAFSASGSPRGRRDVAGK